MLAPPSLRLHVSAASHLSLNAARAAVANADYRARHGGALTLVLDDTRGDLADAIPRDLAWIDAPPDSVTRRGERVALYDTHITALRRSGRLYPCFESEAELKAKAERRRRRGRPDVYDREMMSLTPAQRARAEANGKRPHWRFRLSDGEACWRDATLGPRRVALAGVSDPVLIRADATIASALARAIDDRALAVTHLIATTVNTAEMATHCDLLSALGARQPVIVSLPPLDAAMAGLGGLTLRRLRADGVMAAAARAWLARDVAAGLDTLLALNRANLATAPFAAVADRLPVGATEAFWLGIRDGIGLLVEAETWWRALGEPAAERVEVADGRRVRAALDALPADDAALAGWAPDAATRAALIGAVDDAPPPGFWRLLGRERIARRLRAALGTG